MIKILTCILHTVVNVSRIENVCLYNFIIVMCSTEFIQIEAGLLKVNAGVQHSKRLMYVKCRRGSYKCLVTNHYGKQPSELLLGKYGIWSCMQIKKCNSDEYLVL